MTRAELPRTHGVVLAAGGNGDAACSFAGTSGRSEGAGTAEAVGLGDGAELGGGAEVSTGFSAGLEPAMRRTSPNIPITTRKAPPERIPNIQRLRGSAHISVRSWMMRRLGDGGTTAGKASVGRSRSAGVASAASGAAICA
jgi:hypothetical protein